MMKPRLFLIPTMPSLFLLGGAIVLDGCTPVRSGGGGGGDDDDDSTATPTIVDDWSLRRLGSYTYPSEYTYTAYGAYDPCTRTSSRTLTIEADGDVELSYRTEYEGYCPYANQYPPSIQDGSWSESGAGAWRITFGSGYILDCGLDGDTLECDDESSTRWEFTRQ